MDQSIYPRGLRPRRWNSWSVSLAILATLSTPAEAVVSPFGPSAGTQAAIAVCSTQRAPLLAKEKAYNDIKNARIGAAIGEGVKAGTGVFISGMLKVVPGGGLMAGNPAATQTALGAAQSGLYGQVYSRMNGIPIPGMPVAPGSAPLAGAGIASGKPDPNRLAMVAIFVGIQSSVDTYMKLKQEQFGADHRQMAISVEDDARGQVPTSVETASQVESLSECRQQQVKDLDAKIASASNDKDRKQLLKDKTGLDGALKRDIIVDDDVVGPEVNLAKNFTEGRAMAEGKSEADVLGSQPPAYEATASHEALKLPDPATATPGAPAPPPQPTLVTFHKSTAVRTSPSATASVMLNFPAGRAVTPKGRAEADAAWWEVDMGGASGFIRGADLTESGAAAGSKSKGPPSLAPPTNIRTYNQEVLVARTDGPDRLKTLNTEIETGSRKNRGPYLALDDSAMLDGRRRG